MEGHQDAQGTRGEEESAGMGQLGQGRDLTAAAATWGQLQRRETQTLLRVPDYVTRDKDHKFRLDIRKNSFSKGWCSPGTGDRGVVGLLPWERFG